MRKCHPCVYLNEKTNCEKSLNVLSVANSSDQLLQGLVALGCGYEGADRGYMSSNIPAFVQLEVVRDYLIFKQANWEYADPRYSELFPNDD